MKKIFTLFAAMLMAGSMMAQTEPASYYFDNNASTYTLVGSETGNAFSATTYTMDGVEGFSVNYVLGGEKGYVYLAENGNIFFEYSNSGTKNNVVKTGNAMFVCDSKNFILNVKGLKANDEVYMLYSAKGSSAAAVDNAGNANTEVMADAEKASKGKADNEGKENGVDVLTCMHVKAVANGGIKIKETAAGMRVFAIGINQKPVFPQQASGIENVTATASKSVRKVATANGIQIVKGGKTYNVAGQEL